MSSLKTYCTSNFNNEITTAVKPCLVVPTGLQACRSSGPLSSWPRPLHRNLLTTLSTCSEDAPEWRCFAFQSADVPGPSPTQSKGTAPRGTPTWPTPSLSRAVICTSALFYPCSSFGVTWEGRAHGTTAPGSELTSASPHPGMAPHAQAHRPTLPSRSRGMRGRFSPTPRPGVRDDPLWASRGPGFLPRSTGSLGGSAYPGPLLWGRGRFPAHFLPASALPGHVSQPGLWDCGPLALVGTGREAFTLWGFAHGAGQRVSHSLPSRGFHPLRALNAPPASSQPPGHP